MYGADGFGCGIIGQGIANLILTAKWYGFLSRVCFTLIGSTSLGEEKVKIGQNWPKNCYSKQRLWQPRISSTQGYIQEHPNPS